jgi:hypothetical protein
MMNNRAELNDSLWCLVFSMTSMGGWLWFFWDIAAPIQRFL